MLESTRSGGWKAAVSSNTARHFPTPSTAVILDALLCAVGHGAKEAAEHLIEKADKEEEVESPRQYAASLRDVVQQLPFDDITRIADILFRAYAEDRAVFVFGNGGSAALASHAACDLGKGITPLPAEGGASLRRLRIMSLTDNVPMISAWANDASYEDVFARQMEDFIRPADIAFGLSGSGNSPNILKALRLAREKQAVTVGFSGQGGEMIGLLDHAAVVPSRHMQLVEDCQLIMMHMVFLNLRERIAGSAG